MTPKYSESEAVRLIEQHMRETLAEEGDVYTPARKIHQIAFTHAAQYGNSMWPLWLIWGALTAPFEVRPEESVSAKEDIIRASREWLALVPGDADARKSYFDRWIYDELGIERKEEPNQAPRPTPPSRRG